MTIQEVKDRWSPGMKDPQAAIDWWNSKAGAFASRDIPTAQSSLAIRLITEKQMIERGQSSLDVGCGGGRFPLHWSSWEPVPQALIFHRE